MDCIERQNLGCFKIFKTCPAFYTWPLFNEFETINQPIQFRGSSRHSSRVKSLRKLICMSVYYQNMHNKKYVMLGYCTFSVHQNV